VCQYYNQLWGTGIPLNCDQHGKDDCEQWYFPPGSDPATNCRWNRSTNQCENIYWRACEMWAADPAQKDCSEISISEFKPSSNPFGTVGNTNKCEKVRYAYFGHGQWCRTWVDYTKLCLNSRNLANCSNFDADIGGCQTFNDPAAAETAFAAIVNKIGNKCLTVSGNQCDADSFSCQSRYIITIDPNASPQCRGRPDVCWTSKKDSKICYNWAVGASALCMDGNRKTNKVCCKKDEDTYEWILGTTCP
jgi:hypothetical protein